MPVSLFLVSGLLALPNLNLRVGFLLGVSVDLVWWEAIRLLSGSLAIRSRASGVAIVLKCERAPLFWIWH